VACAAFTWGALAAEVPVGEVGADNSGLFIAKAVSALDAMATVQPSTALKTSINGLLKITIRDRVVEKCRDGSGGGGVSQYN